MAVILAGAISVACMAQEEEDEQDGPIAFTYATYSYCKLSTQTNADERLKNVQAPIYDELVEEGVINSWGWLAHFIGGKYRRLQTMTGADHKAVLAARGDLIEALYGGDEPNAAAVEFNEICGSHSDYLWDVQMETP